VLLEAADFAAPNLTGVANPLANYIGTVAAPLAKNSGASALLCGQINLHTDGALPGTSASFPPLTAYGIVLAMEFAVAAEIRITNVQVLPNGIKLQWSPLAGKSYSVQSTAAVGTSFATLASNIAGTEYLDT